MKIKFDQNVNKASYHNNLERIANHLDIFKKKKTYHSILKEAISVIEPGTVPWWSQRFSAYRKQFILH